MTTWILLRGLARESRHWGVFPQLLAAHLPQGHRVLAVDLPGNGRLFAQPSPATVSGMVAALRRELAAHGEPGPFAVLALSLGGMVALEWAAQPDSNVAGLVLVNTSLRDVSPFWQRLRPGAWPALARIGAARVSRRESLILKVTSARAEGQAGVAAQWIAWALKQPTSRVNALRQLLAAARFRGCAVPVQPGLLLASRQDALVSPRCSEDLAHRWNWPLEMHDWAGHDLPLDDPRWLAAKVGAWAGETGWGRGEVVKAASRSAGAIADSPPGTPPDIAA